MADVRHRTTWGNRFRFLDRALGLLGLMVAIAGAVLTAATFRTIGQWTSDTARAALNGEAGPFARAAVGIFAAGVVVVALALVVELLGGLFLVATRRTAAGTAATLGTAAAVALLVIVNAYSFTHYRRADCTRDHRFTLPAAVADDLRKLRPDSPTTVVVLQTHTTFGDRLGKADSYATAAEQKVTEKVRDLVDQIRELGPRFHIAVLDTRALEYGDQLAAATKDAPELKAAIDAAPENSIFFHANGRVQRLGFDEFMALDKTASRAANDGRGNLVLLPQGVESFARRVLAVQERRPKAAICVVHPVLGTEVSEGRETYTAAGARKVLTAHGFDVVDIVLKKNWEDGEKELEPAAYTREESRLGQLEGDLIAADDEAKAAKAEVAILGQVIGDIKEVMARPWKARVELYSVLNQAARNQEWLEVVAALRKWTTGERKLSPDTEPQFRADVLAGLEAQRKHAGQEAADADKARRAADDKFKAALKDERPIQDRRVTDVKAKFARLLADVDLLIVPRLTVMSAPEANFVPANLHGMSKDQVAAVKDFMKAGKPVLACLGPISGPAGPRDDAADDFEKLLADRGIELGRETILFTAEAREFASRRSANQFGGGSVEIPPLVIADRPADGGALDPAAPAAPTAPNPVGAALLLTGRGVDQKLDIRLRAPRPVYLAPGAEGDVRFAAAFAFAGPDAWNEEKPFVQADRAGRIVYRPRYEPTARDAAGHDTHRAERRGLFPVGLAVESKLPAEWFDDTYAKRKAAADALTPALGPALGAGLAAGADKADRPTGRLVVFGSGGLFTGAELKPANEKLLLHAANWLVNRPDRLPAAPDQAWSFPRVELSERDTILWRGGTAVLMPLGAVFLGLFAVMVRRMR